MIKKLILPTVLALSSTLAMADTEEQISVVTSYTCDRLVAMDFEDVPSAVYYIEGFSDSDEVVDEITEEDFVSVPVERVYTYCYQNPDEVVADVIEKFDDED